jgi:hypothetical protein
VIAKRVVVVRCIAEFDFGDDDSTRGPPGPLVVLATDQPRAFRKPVSSGALVVLGSRTGNLIIVSHRLFFAAFVVVCVASATTLSWAGRVQLNERFYEGCLRDSANRVDDARKAASDSIREDSLSRTDGARNEAAHEISAGISEGVARTYLVRVGVRPPARTEQITYMNPFSAVVMTQRTSYCKRSYPRPALLGISR